MFCHFPILRLGSGGVLDLSIPDLCHLLNIDPIFSVWSLFGLEVHVDKSRVGHAYCKHLAIVVSIFVALTTNKIYNNIDRAITV